MSRGLQLPKMRGIIPGLDKGSIESTLPKANSGGRFDYPFFKKPASCGEEPTSSKFSSSISAPPAGFKWKLRCYWSMSRYRQRYARWADTFWVSPWERSFQRPSDESGFSNMAKNYAYNDYSGHHNMGAEDRLKSTSPGFPCQHDNWVCIWNTYAGRIGQQSGTQPGYCYWTRKVIIILAVPFLRPSCGLFTHNTLNS